MSEENADSKLTMRKGGAELIAGLEPLWLALHAHHQSVAPEFTYFDDARSWELRSACYREWLAEDGSFVLLAEANGGQPVGYALVRIKEGPDDTWVTGARIAELESISVLPERRGEGIGTLLLDAVDAELDALGIGDLFIGALAANTSALRLYEKRGLRPMLVYMARLKSSPCGD